MSTVTALVSAYHAEKFIKKRMANLTSLKPAPEIFVICQWDSAESLAISKYECSYVLTPDTPTIYKAWNIGIAHSEGDYLTSANCDDLFYPQGLNVMQAYLDEHPDIDLVYGDCDMRVFDKVFEWKRGESDLENGINRIGAMPMWRHSLHTRFGLFDESMTVSGDYEFWLRCVRGGAKIAHINETVGLYWRRNDSLEHRNKDAMKSENALIREIV